MFWSLCKNKLYNSQVNTSKTEGTYSIIMKSIYILFWILENIYCMGNEDKTAISIKQLYMAHSIPIAIGFHNYTALAFASMIFSDKSLLIKEMLEDANKLVLITCPRHWGKTINIHMLKTFLEMKVDKNGVKIPPNYTLNYQVFINGRITLFKDQAFMKKHFYKTNETVDLEEPPIISQHHYITDQYLGKYPVLYVDLWSVSWAKDFKAMLAEMKKALCITFADHTYMIGVLNRTVQSEHSDENVKAEARKGLQLFHGILKEHDKLNADDLVECLNLLSKLLRQHFNTKVFVLVDDYDIPWSTVFTRSWLQKDIDDFLVFYYDFMRSTIKTNIHMEKAVVTGRLPPFKELNFLLVRATECSFLNGKLMEYYGFTPLIMKRVINETRLYKRVKNASEKMQHWYNGYRINNKNLTLYNSWSVVNIVHRTINARIRRIWTFTEDVKTFLDNCFKNTTFLFKLISLSYGNDIDVQYDQHFTWTELKELHQLQLTPTPNTEDYDVTSDTEVEDTQFADRAIMFLYTLGYITLSENFDEKSPCQHFRMKLPNEETASAIRQQIKLYFERELWLHEPEAYDHRIMLPYAFGIWVRNREDNGTMFQNALTKYLTSAWSFYANFLTIEELDQKYLHAMLTYLLTDIKCIGKEDSLTANLPTNDAILIFHNRSVIVSLDFRKASVQLVLNQAKKHMKVIQERNLPTQEIKIVAVNMLKNCSVNVLAETYT